MENRIRYAFLVAFIFLLASCGTSNSMRHQPELTGYNDVVPPVKKHSNTSFSMGNNFLFKNKQNLWELYVEGDPLERGLVMGSLTDSLILKQNRLFFSKIKEIVPSKFKQRMLRNFLKWYNRKLYLNVPEEYQTEIYGVSKNSNPEYDYLASSYQRSLYLHAAHDIGHVLQDFKFAGCSSFAAWGDKTEDGSLILGRNLDFYAGDDFAQDKLVSFVNPKKGHPFMMVTWPGMIGVLSGMNIEGLTVTINSAKSKIPLIAKTPISILTREILQYAKNIEEAIVIAKKRKVFVSESIMVGSAYDKKAILIEVSPDTMGIYDVPNSNQLICTNHFQSNSLKNADRNLDQIVNSHSKYRYDRMTQLLAENKKITPQVAVNILRNTEGFNNLPLGYGNEKAINYLLAHHGVVFKPDQLLVWVSANPYQLGEFVCYDLNTIFKNRKCNDTIVSSEKNTVSLGESGMPFPNKIEENLFMGVSLEDEKRNIPKDPFLETTVYKNYELFRLEDRKMDAFLKNKKGLPVNFIEFYQSLNPDYWVVYYKAGLYFYQNKKFVLAKEQFEKALTKEIGTLTEREVVSHYLKKIKRKL
ncbi:C45 family autoproteolytic acyltransferase/hydolase [Flavobacterium laiguense]|uniref:Acyl-CoA--6-aminopenicillanic acid acyl-transferase n=1 Tax=Flavobacterium laiguense TaxID=2169409 RepID=A0A2U1JV72_9FLAO|nr:C45 family peptidase [Flavobacterium laiguense]PWA09110.1 acyl-CoA--6-aminopenicillanic acid acyl-transferase [Flavobacterium laiguense]